MCLCLWNYMTWLIVKNKQTNSVRINKDAFQGENMQIQYSVLGYKIDLYFHEYKLAIEIEELGHILTTKYREKKQ